MSTQLNELRLQVERLDYDNKESIITIDILREQNQDSKNELDELKKIITDLRTAQKDASAEDKEKRKQEKMALMMAKFDAVCFLGVSGLLDANSVHSKERSPKRMSNFANCLPNSTLSTPRQPSRLSQSTMWSQPGDSSRKLSLWSARLLTAYVKARRRMR